MTEPELGSLDDLVARIDAAVAAAAPPAPAAEDEAVGGRGARSAPVRHVVFSLAGARCAVPIANVVETGYAPALTRVPNVPRWVAGVTNLRGDVLAVVDLRSFLGLERLERPSAARLLVAQSAALECRAGFLIDGLHGAFTLSPGEIRQPDARLEPPLDERLAAFVHGEVEREDGRVALLDLEAIFQTPEMRRLRGV